MTGFFGFTLGIKNRRPRGAGAPILLTITSPASFSTPENQAFSATATANKAVTWSKSGTDAAIVTLNAATGAWSIPAQDFETKPTVSFTLTATAGAETANQNIQIAIGDVADSPPPTNTVAPSITGTAQEGQTLTLSNGSWTGTGPITYAVQWLSNGAAIANAIGQTLVLQAAHVGTTISARVTASNAGGPTEAVSNTVGPVATGKPVNTVAPTLSGTAQQGSVLTTSNGTWSNSPMNYFYLWQRDDVDISGATGPTYTLTAADVGKQINSGVIASNTYGANFMKSAKTPAVTSAVPDNIASPQITGTALEGETLTCSTGTWTGPNLTYTRQWYRGAGTAISGATGATYVATAADVGFQLRCDVTASNSYGTVTEPSNYTGAVVAAGGLSSTNATVVSLAGEPPEVDLDMGPDIADGYILRIQRATDNTTNPDGTYVTPTLDISYYITPSNRATGTITNADLADVGYADPTGAGFQQYRYEREDGVVGPFTEITYNVTASVAKLVTVDGVDRHNQIASTDFQMWAESNANTAYANKVNVNAAPDKFHYEVTIDNLRNDGNVGVVLTGLMDPSVSVASVSHVAGNTNLKGSSCRVSATGTNMTVARNGGVQQAALGGAPVAGDKIIVEGDKTTQTVVYRYWRASLGTVVATITITHQDLTGSAGADYRLTNWRAYGACYRGSTTTPSLQDRITFNLGGADAGTPFSVAPTSGYSFYG